MSGAFDKNLFRINNKNENTAEISIYTDIGLSFWDDSLSAKQFNEELKKISDKVTQIDVRLNSPGGDVFDGITMFNRLKQHKANVTVYVDGLAASIASVIAMAGNKIIMGEGALMMIHKPWTYTAGDSSALEEVIDRLNDVEEQIIGIYQRRTKVDRAEIRKMIAETTWMDSTQAVELGFADESMAQEIKIAASAMIDRATWITKRPKMLTQNDVLKMEIDNFLKGKTTR
jgi:ATP-dependent protease ClpP protease subunit